MVVESAVSVAVESVLFSALAKLSEKRTDRDLLVDGSAHEVAINLEAHVDGFAVGVQAVARLLVGHGCTKSQSSPVAPAAVLGHVCELLALAFGDAAVVEVLDAITAKHAGSGAVDCSKEWETRAEAFAAGLRAQSKVFARGPVKCDVSECLTFVSGGE
jgi:hypothetical protein